MYFLGVDLGQKQDPTALALLEKPDAHPVHGGEMGGLYLTGLQRVPLGTPYMEVVAKIQALTEGTLLSGQVVVVVDATGVGIPVVEQLRRAVRCEVAAVTITSGEKGSQKGRDYTTPKQDLMAALLVSLEQNELRIARRMRETGALVKELMNMRSTARESGRTRLGADRFGEHDDLAIATALAVWRAKRHRYAGLREGLLPLF